VYLLKNPNRKMNKALSEPQALDKSLQQGAAGLATLPALTYALFNTQVVVDLNKQGFRKILLRQDFSFSSRCRLPVPVGPRLYLITSDRFKALNNNSNRQR
jgi:hypothetical protein